MNTSFIVLLIIQLVLLIFSACIMYLILSSKYLHDLDKRFLSYTITNNKNIESSFFDKFYIKIWLIIKKASRLFNKIEILKKYSVKYEKYINNNNIEGIDYITIKFIISLICGILYLLSSTIRSRFNALFFMTFLIFGFYVSDIYYIIDYKIRRKTIENGLLSAIIIMNNAFKSGMNITQAVNIVKEELTGSIKEEFNKISKDIEYGLSLETVFDRFYNRVKIEDIKYISSSLSLINKTGGNIVRVFNSIEKNFYDKKKIKDEMDSLISSSKYMFNMLVSMPIILVIVILFLNKDFFVPLLTTVPGRLIIVLILILYLMYIFVVKKIMKVEV